MSEIYTPPGSLSLSRADFKAQIRMGEQGFPGTGKTYSALTFPNPIVANVNRGLGAHAGRSDVIELPFCDPDFNKRYSPSEPTNIKIGFETWLATEAPKLTINQTLVVDALTDLESAYHTHWNGHKVYSKSSGKVDDFAEWGLKQEYFGYICDTLMKLKCDVIMITHEAEKKDKSGEYSGKIRPLLTGSFADKIVSKFTDWFRQMCCAKADLDKLTSADAEGIKKTWGMTIDEYKAMCNMFPRNTIYYWQTESDNTFDGKCSSLVNFPSRIPACYSSFAKYMRKPISTT